MLFMRKKNAATEVLGRIFSSPAGSRGKLYSGAGFVTLNPPHEGILEWINSLSEYKDKTILAINISSNIVKTFSLVYDFSDLIIVDPDSDRGIDSPDISDTSVLIDELVSLRLCYEHYTPIALRLSHGHTPEEIKTIVGHSRLSGIDAIVAPGPVKVRTVVSETDGRLPVIGAAENPEEALATLEAGAVLTEVHTGPFSFHKLLKELSKK